MFWTRDKLHEANSWGSPTIESSYALQRGKAVNAEVMVT